MVGALRVFERVLDVDGEPVVVGGLGSLAGAFIAAMVLGMIQALGAVYLPDVAVLLPFAVMVGVLIWKPAGFAGSRT